jgi:hypothetical protein
MEILVRLVEMVWPEIKVIDFAIRYTLYHIDFSLKKQALAP